MMIARDRHPGGGLEVARHYRFPKRMARQEINRVGVDFLAITHESQHVAVVRALKAIIAPDKSCETPCMIVMEPA